MNRHLAFIFLIIISLLSGCVEERTSTQEKTPKKEVSPEQVEQNQSYVIKNAAPLQFKVGEQEFDLVPVFNPILEYIQKMNDNSDADHKELYISTVVEPFRKEAFGEDGGLWLKDKYNFAAPINIKRLNESIQILDKDFEHFSHLIKEALEKSATVLPGGKTTIYLFPFNPDQYSIINQMNGVTAFATSNKVIVLQIAPQNYDEETLKYVLAHEYHHTVYLEGDNNQRIDLIDYVLTEGKADSFAHMIIPELTLPWITELTQDEEQAILNWAIERRYSYDTDDLVELNAGNHNIPRLSGYKIGYQIMQDFLKKNPNVSISEWTFMKTDEILENGRFAEKLK
ncbi:DUF2268 domain-containing protein [Bacillus sp. FJAT-27245]|uniref:DUF2268 domain-containing protein n=1 Tax=Bacillus sp. FJAT-27245 TaxID=1684144 RepID=UPI0006A7DA0B|nr:DUF2268 domain-containing putative Zn-dependent protease [Bacillus sp. FJAT-27245]